MMARGLIGKKLGMTQVFDEANQTAIPVTVIALGPCTVTQVKDADKHGYESVQVGYDEVAPKKVTKAILGHQKHTGKAFRHMKEFEKPSSEVKAGDVLTVDIFKDVARVDIQGVTKGRGFQGVIKRHNGSRGDKTHGGKCYRIPGSMGNRTNPGKVWPHKKLPGHMGHITKTVQNLDIVKADAQRNLLFVRGAVPGSRDGLVYVTAAIKSRTVSK